MPTRSNPHPTKTWFCCHRCGSLFTLAHPCRCRDLRPAEDDLPGKALSVWPLLAIAVLLVVALLLMISTKGCV